MNLKLSDEKMLEYIKLNKKFYGGTGLILFALWIIGFLSMIRVPSSYRLISWVILIAINVGMSVLTWNFDNKRTLLNQNLFDALVELSLTIIFVMFIFNYSSFYVDIDFGFILFWLISYISFSIIIILITLNKILKISYKNHKSEFLLKFGTPLILMIYPLSRVLIKILNSDQSIVILLFIVLMCSFYTLKITVHDFLLYYFQKKLNYDEELEIEEKQQL